MRPILDLLGKRVLLCDGAMGTMLQEGGLPAGACPEETVLSDQALVREVHRRYMEAGAEIIETNTFGANRLKLAEYGLEGAVERINREAVRLAKSVSAGKAYVAGSVGPLGTQVEPLGELSFAGAVEAFREQMKALARGGVDIIFLETISDIREAKAACVAAREVTALPIVAHMTFGEDGRTFTGTPPEVAAVVLASLGAAGVGANCGVGPEGIMPSLEAMARVSPVPLSVLPNAGLPEIVEGRTVFRESPEAMAAFMDRFAALGVSLVGGCCGTTPAHIGAMAAALRGKRPSKRKVAGRLRLCSRTRLVEIEGRAAPLVIGERINLSVRKKVARAFIEGDASEVRRMARSQVEAGAHALDLNGAADAGPLGARDAGEGTLMRRLVRVVQRSVEAPLVIDSSSPAAIEAGLEEVEGKPLVNSISAERGKTEPLLTLARKYAAAIVILPISGGGVPKTAARRVKIAEEVRARALRAGIAPEDILIDPIVLAASAAHEQAAVTLEALRMLKARGYQTVIGVSNVSFGLPARSVLNAAFLGMAMGAGLDAVILNPSDELVMRALAASRVLMARDRGASDFVSRLAAARAPAPEVALAPGEVRERLTEAVLAGDREGAIARLEEALSQGLAPLEINLSILTPALEEVGRRFERKEIFLPQMILSAETVQNAFARLRKEMKGERMPSRGTIVMATVRGDVHDIGKNICCTVLENYGYSLVDLGRDVAAEVIADSAEKSHADIVGLSALMTTTMTQMEFVIAEMKRRGLKAKVMVGGAVVTPAYAKKIGADGYAKDAGGIVRLAKELMGEA